METATQELHRLTSYTPDRDWDAPPDDPRARHDFQSNDYATLPLFYKRYAPGLPRLALPRELPTTTAPALAVLSGTGLPGAGLTGTGGVDLPALARLLHWSAGIVRTSPRATYTHLFRAAGTAGGRFPLDIYIAVPAGYPGLPEGVHCYDPLEHALVTIGPAPGAGAPTIVVTGVPWRTGWRYGERGYRHVYWDAGTMLAQTLALADSAGIATRLYTRFPDADVAALVGADQVHEWPVAVIALGAGAPVIRPSCSAGPTEPGQTDTAPLEFPLVTAAQRAGDGDTLGEPWDPGPAIDIPGTPATAPAGPPSIDPPSIDKVIVTRGSQRLMDPDRGLPLATLIMSMSVALRGIDVPHWVVVHDVTGLAPGLYRWPDLTTPVREGNLREELYRVTLDQGLSRDAAFVVIAATDVSRLSDREYRDAQLAAGLAEGRLHLAAYALGASATGMTFLDSEIPALLGSREFPDGLIFTCVGVPEYTARQAGQPGAPTSIGRVTERNRLTGSASRAASKAVPLRTVGH